MAFALADSTAFGTADEAADFVDSVLGASTEYSIIGLDLDGTILLWNEGARRLYGYEARDVVGKANVSLLHTPEDVAVGKPAQIAEDALRHGKWEGIVERRRQDGTRFPARVVVNPRRNRDGDVVGLALISTDVSEEVRQTCKLEESRRAEERFRAVLDSSLDAIITADDTGTIMSWNRGAAGMFGHDADAVVGKPLTMLMPQRFRAAHSGAIERLTAGGKPTILGSVVELTAIDSSGEEFPVELSLTGLDSDAGRAYAGILRDLRERSDAEERFRGLLESAPDAMVIVDAQ